MSRHYIFQCQGQQRSFYLSETMDINSFCRLLKTVFEVSEPIVALQDINHNIYDVKYFCQNLVKLLDRFFIVQLASARTSKSRKKMDVRSRNTTTSNILEIQSPNIQLQIIHLLKSNPYLFDFHQFLINLQTRYQNVAPDTQHWTMVILFDSVWQANTYHYRLIEEISAAYPFIQILFTAYKEPDWAEETILLTLFDNQHLRLEQEVLLDQQVIPTIFNLLNTVLNEQASSEPQQIPIIVTRGDHKQILHVEPNDNFHSSQGKRTQGLTRIKRELEKVRDHLEDSEYMYLLDLIVAQDPNIFAAHQLFQRVQDEEQFAQNLKALVPKQTAPRIPPLNNLQEMQDTNMSFNKRTSAPNSTRQTHLILEQLLKKYQSQMTKGELGTLKVVEPTVEFNELVASVAGQDDEVIYQVLKPYLRDRFLSYLEEDFNGGQIDWLLKHSIDKVHPIYAALMNFAQLGDLKEFIDVCKENLPEEQHQDYSFPPRQIDDTFGNENQHCYSLLLKQKGDKRKSTFKFKIHMGDDQQQANESPVQRRKKSEEDYQLQILKENQFIDKFHNKVVKYMDHDHEKLLLEVFEQNILEEEEKTKLADFYHQGNQRLRDILDNYKESKDLSVFKIEITDLVSLGSSKRFEEISSPTNGALFEPKIQKLRNFRFLVNYYYEIEKIFNLKQIKTFVYLYVTEDISLLSAYEVYCETQDQDEFIQTLNLIYKIYSLGNYIELDFEEIEQFDELIDQQLNILFTYRRFFNVEQRSSLEKNLRAGDNTLLSMFKDFMRTKNQNQFIESARKFADLRGVDLKRIEKILVERRQKLDEQKNESKDLIEKLHPQFMRNKVKHIDMLLEGVDKDSTFLKSAFEVYKYTLDKQDLVENLVLIYNQIYKANVKTMLKSLSIVLQLQKTDLTALLKRIDQEEPILKGAFELYYINRDEQELKDTITRMIRLSQN